MSQKIEKSDAEWQKELDPLQHHVLRNHGTERPFTSPLNNEKRAGTFRCAGCGEPRALADCIADSRRAACAAACSACACPTMSEKRTCEQQRREGRCEWEV